MKFNSLCVLAFLVALFMFTFTVVILNQDQTITQQKTLIRLLYADTQRLQAACK